MIEPVAPLTKRLPLEEEFQYNPQAAPFVPNTPFKGLDIPAFVPPVGPGAQNPIVSGLAAYRASLGTTADDGKLTGGSIQRSIKESTSRRYDNVLPGTNMEDAYGLGQSGWDQMANGLGKGLVLAGTTFIQSTAGMLNGVVQASQDGRFASFYDNEFNRSLDEYNKAMEDYLPNYYTDAQRNARWYAPSKIFSANFIWDGVVKNLGFAAGAAAAGGFYGMILKSLPLLSRLVSIGKSAETLAATEEALAAAGKGAEMYGKVKGLSDTFLGSYKVLNTGGRVLVAGLATTGEAGFEAFHNLNDFRDQKIQEYRDTHDGASPFGADLDEINEAAEGIGNTSMALNTALLSATNYIQFPKILGSSYTAEKGMINGLTKEIGGISKDATGKFVRDEATTRLGKLAAGAERVGGYLFSPSEGFEEGAQFAITVGTKDYYDKQYSKVATDIGESIGVGIAKTLGTDEGLENILIGGLSGALMTGIGRYKQGRDLKTNTGAAVEAFNKWRMSDFTKETLNGVKRGVVLQQEREDALKRGDILESKEREADYIINYLTPRIKYGRWDLVMADINEYRELASTEEGFAQLQAEGKVIEGDTREQYLNRIANLEGTANSVKSLYQSLQLRYGNYVTPDGKPLYSEDVMSKMIYAATKVADYDKRLIDLSAALATKGVLINDVLDKYAKGDKTAYNEAVKKITDSKSIHGDETLVQLKDAATLSERREQFLNEYQDIKNNPVKHKDIVDETKIDPKTGKPVTINIKEGVDLEVGAEYYGGETFQSEEAGEKKRYTKFTVIGENEKGDVLIKTADGKRHSITKQGLAKYSLAKTSDVKSKNAIAFIRGAHREFTYNRGKGKHVVGTIAYNSKTDKLWFKSHDGKFERPITREDLIPQKGFNVAKVYTKETLTPEEIENANQPVPVDEKLALRNQVIVSMYTEAKEELESIDAFIKENQEALEKAKTDIEEAQYTKKGTLRAVNATKRIITKASKIKETAEKNLEKLQGRKEELTQVLPYLQDLSEHSRELPTSGAEMIAEMKESIDNIKDLIESTDREIKLTNSLIEAADYVLKAAFHTLNAAIDKFKAANPNVPINVEALQEQIEKFLGEEGAKQFIEQKLGFTQLVAEFQEAMSELETDLKVPDLKKEVGELTSKISELQSAIENLGSEKKAKEMVVARFEKVAADFKKQKEEEALVAKNDALFAQFLGTHTTGEELEHSDKVFNPIKLKNDDSVINGSISVDDGKPHQKRANTFGINLPHFKNRDKLRAIEVTSKTEAKAGIPGLMAYLHPTATEKERESIVAVIFVQDNGNKGYSFVNEDGEPIVDDLLNNAIFQTRPTEKLSNTMGTMFREAQKGQTKEHRAAQVKILTDRYEANRKFVLASEEVQPMKKFNASMGILKYEQKGVEGKDETVDDFGAKNTVFEAELIDEDTLSEQEVLEVAILNDPTPENGVTFTGAIGRVFMRLAGVGLVKLNTTLLGKRKAESIYNTIHQVAKNIVADPQKGGEKSQPLFAWLSSVIYWGIPRNMQTGERKDAKYNSVWFEKDPDGVTRLYISGKGESFIFTPTDIEARKADIIFLLSNMYHNVSNTELKKGLKEYREITGFKEDGTPKYEVWKNYQTYLLSKTGSEDAPLVTPILAIKGTEKENREGIYFTMMDNIDSEIEEEEAPAPATTVVTSTGTSAGIYKTPEGKEIHYIVKDGKILINPGVGDIDEVLTRLKGLIATKNPDMDDAELKAAAADAIKAKIATTIPTQVAPQEEQAEATTNTKRRTVFDKEEKPAEKKPQEPAKTEVPKMGPKDESPKSGQQPARVESDTTPDTVFGKPVKITKKSNEVFRLQVIEEGKQVETEDWNAVEKWLKANFPNLPIYRVKNVIQATNGAQAWGMLKNGAIYVYENAEVGTVYHEVFEGVWKIFTDKAEQTAILNEFRQRKGTFTDRETGKTLKYSDATDKEAKEELAEEFRDFVLFKKIPKKPDSGRPYIVKLFNDIVDYIKTFFTDKDAKTNTQKLFDKIGTGYYKQYTPFDSNLAFANAGFIPIDNAKGEEGDEFRKIPYPQRHELMQHMTYTILSKMIKENSNILAVENITDRKAEIYAGLKEGILSVSEDEDEAGILKMKASILETDKPEGWQKKLVFLNDLYKEINDNWESLVAEHLIYLKQYNIEFDENDSLVLADEDHDKGADGHPDARKVDYFRKSNPAIKMLLATIPVMQYQGDLLGPDRSSIGGIRTLPLDKTFITLKNRLFDSLDVDDMMDKLRDIAKNDPNYRSLYTRLTRMSPDSDDAINYESLKKTHDIELLSAFYKVMKAQNADVKVVYILPGGEVHIGDAHLADASRQVKADMFSDIVAKLKTKSAYIAFNKTTKEYNATDAIKKLNLTPGRRDQYIAFLKAIDVSFTKEELDILTQNGNYKAFEEAVNGIKESITSIANVKDLNKYSIGLEGRLLGLASIKAALTNPDFESTYFNISGEKTQTYIGTNVMSDLYHTISRINNIGELKNTPYAYLLTDSFTVGEPFGNDKYPTSSAVLNLMFNSTTGNKKDGANGLLATGIVEGIVDQPKAKSKDSSKVTAKDRIIEELNLNHKGWFLNLVPGDASIEWMVRLFKEGKPYVSSNDLRYGWNQDNVFDIFKKYFISEVNVSRDINRTIPTVEGRDKSDLRFFKSILGTTLHDKIVKDKKSSAKKLYDDHVNEINAAVKKFIQDEAQETIGLLKDYGIVKYGETGMEVDGLSIAKDNMSEDALVLELEASQINYMIANIELHKLVYSDPYFYKDELKRVKNFNSPAQPLMTSKAVNGALARVYNQGFAEGSTGWTNFNIPSLTSTVNADVKSYINGLKGYEGWEETDGAGIITFQAYRNIRIRSANWNEKEESQYRHDIGYEELEKSGASAEELKKYDKKNPQVKSAYTPLKPIVRGSKADGHNFNDIVLDKFALTPFSFRILHVLNPTSNAIQHYNKMRKDGVDYTVYKSGRKVGAGYENPVYNADGGYNSSPFQGLSVIPLQIISIQTEVPSKDTPEVTQGSQVTKLATMDFMDAGVPLDFMRGKGDLEERFAAWTLLKTEAEKEAASPLYKLIKYNETILNERINHGYTMLLSKLGISPDVVTTTDAEGNSVHTKTFTIGYIDKLINTLTSEIYKREVNDNIIEAFKGFKSGEVVLESTPAYQQIRNILYAIANKQVTRPTISGGLKVQVTSAMLESVRAEEVTSNGKKVYASTNLGFYEMEEGGKKVKAAEIMVGRWFKSDKSDEELLRFFNDTDEGRKILAGVAFRIPTQKQNSIDVFKIKQFLPQEFGDSVIIPSALVNKAGSDFDIDKLSIYFKNVYEDARKNIRIMPFYGFGQDAIEKFQDLFLSDVAEAASMLRTKINTNVDLADFYKEIAAGLKEGEIADKWLPIFQEWFRDEMIDGELPMNRVEEIFMNRIEKMNKKLKELTDDDVQEILAIEISDKWYKQSLENEYIQSLEDLTSQPDNYEKLITPNSAKPLQNLANEIVGKLGRKEIDYSSVGNMLNRNFMERLRQAFVRGKYAIGIAATAQTNHAQNQRSPITIDYERLDKQSDDDKKWLGDGKIKFQQYNKLGGKPTLSLARNAAGKLISDIIGMFIDGYVDISKGPWIMELGATPNTAGTWLFLIKMGVPVETVAYFMNQPIIREHLKQVEKAGYVWVFNDAMADIARSQFRTDSKIDRTTLPSNDALEKMVGKKVLSDKEKAQQLFILDEFFKYSKYAEQLFHVQQGSNFDTASINDPFLVFKKLMQLEKARGTMISSVDDILDNSFVGNLKDVLVNVRDAFSTILISDKPGSVRRTLEQVLLPYIDMSDREFIKVSQKAVFDLFDWAVQTNQEINDNVKDILLSETNYSAPEEVMQFVKEVRENKDHPLHGNYIIDSLRHTSESTNEGKPVNLYMVGKINKTYDQNNLIYGFNEIRDYLKKEGNLRLYTNLVYSSVIQSGLANSPISFTQLLPYEDFKGVYNETLSVLDKLTNLQSFVDLHVFERNNWNNSDIVSSKKSQWLELDAPYFNKEKGYNTKWVKTPELDFLPLWAKMATAEGNAPQMMQLSIYSREGQDDFVNLSWEADITKEEKQAMRKKADYSYIKRGLFKKVYDGENPIISSYTSKKTDKTYLSYIYKAVNAWGDSYRANEFYEYPQQSVIENGFIKVDEVDDGVIVDLYRNYLKTAPKTSSTPKKALPKPEMTIIKPINIWAGGTKPENAHLSNFATRPNTDPLGVRYKTVEGAFQAAKLNFATKNTANSEIGMKLQSASGAEAKRLGQTIVGLNTSVWDRNSSMILKQIMKESFIENPKDLAKLLETGNAILTHTQDKSKWGKEFPRLLMEIRDELRKGTTQKPKC